METKQTMGNQTCPECEDEFYNEVDNECLKCGHGKNRFADWKKRYQEANTWANAKVLVDELSQEESKGLNDALKIVGLWTGLDMRQDFLQGLLANKVIEGGSY